MVQSVLLVYWNSYYSEITQSKLHGALESLDFSEKIEIRELKFAITVLTERLYNLDCPVCCHCLALNINYYHSAVHSGN